MSTPFNDNFPYAWGYACQPQRVYELGRETQPKPEPIEPLCVQLVRDPIRVTRLEEPCKS